MTLTVGSLFSGMGGFDLACARAGFIVRWQVEIDPHCRKVLSHRFPGVPCYPDVIELKGEVLEPVDLLCGGFPCQDLSVAGRRAGLAGARSGLWWEFHRLVAELRPRWVLIENVPGLLSSNGGRDMGTILRSLGELGFWWAYRVLDSQHFGVPQRRRRVFIVGHSGNRTYPVQVLFEPEGSAGDSPAGRTAGQDVAGTLGGGSGNRGWADDTDRMTFVAQSIAVRGRDGGSQAELGGDVSNALRAGDGGSSRSALMLIQQTTHALTSEGADASEDGTGRGTPLIPMAFTNRALITGDVTETQRAMSHGALPIVAIPAADTLQVSETPAVAFDPANDDRVIDWAKEIPTASSLVVRRLMPVETLRLQGFPDDWLDGLDLSDLTKYRLVGNAVTVQVVEWIVQRVKEVDGSCD